MTQAEPKMKYFGPIAIAVGYLFTPVIGLGQTYNLAPKNISYDVEVSAESFNFTGTAARLEGSINLNEGTISSIDAIVPIDSLDTGNGFKTKNMK